MGRFRAAGGGSQIGPVASLMRFDAQYYSRIVENGYSYSPMHGSNVAFFPAYPLVARVLRGRLGIPSSTALLIVANGCLAGAMFVFARYLGIRRQPKGDANCRGDAGSPSPPATFLSAPQSDARRARSSAHALWALALLPTTFFFRMPYSEALFLFVALVALYAIERRMGTALDGRRRRPRHGRSAGRCRTPSSLRVVRNQALPFGGRLSAIGTGAMAPQPSMARNLGIPLGCWGLLAYMIFQFARFGDALAFAKTQAYFRERRNEGPVEKVLSLVSWEPIWSVYEPDTPAYFGGFSNGEWAHSMRFFNPIFFCGTAALIAIGAWKRWLNTYEILFAAGLLAIPYFSRAYEMCMESHGRFAAVVVPVYIVIGELLACLPRWLAVVFLTASHLGLGFLHLGATQPVTLFFRCKLAG